MQDGLAVVRVAAKLTPAQMIKFQSLRNGSDQQFPDVTMSAGLLIGSITLRRSRGPHPAARRLDRDLEHPPCLRRARVTLTKACVR
jgi:hypothetical protein